MKYLLDTHILLWWLEGSDKLSAKQQAAIDTISPHYPLLVADITLWEIATLWELGRIKLTLPLRDWLEKAVAPPLISLCAISPAIASEVATLPASFHRDSADRLIVATARVYGATLITSDTNIISAAIIPTIS